MTGDGIWKEKAAPILGAREVHVWRAQLQVDAATLLACRNSLSAEEIARAGRFYFERHARRFIVGRGALRNLVGRYLGVPAAEVEFDYSANGKPSVRHPSATIRFNASHSGELFVAAFSAGSELGVDIEETDRRVAAMEISERFFTPDEHAEIQQQESGKRVETFLRFWTAKEAIMKATGLGLLLEPAAIAIGLNPLKLISVRSDVSSAWDLHGFDPAPGYIGTLAVDPDVNRIEYFEWCGTFVPTRPSAGSEFRL